MGGNPSAVEGGTGKAEAAKLQDAGISPKQWPKKRRGRKRLAYPTRRKSARPADHVNMRDEKNGREMYARGCCSLEEQHRSERGTVSHRWDWAISGAWWRSQRGGHWKARERSGTDAQEKLRLRLSPLVDITTYQRQPADAPATHCGHLVQLQVGE
jgi:hypothetical protein